MYVFEIQQFNSTHSVHVGYVNKLFTTQREALAYYNTYHPTLPAMCAATYRSDVAPITNLIYIVREYRTECLNISPLEMENGVVASTTTVRPLSKREELVNDLNSEIISNGKRPLSSAEINKFLTCKKEQWKIHVKDCLSNRGFWVD